MSTKILAVSTLYRRQTTIPKEVRAVLKLVDGDKLIWYLDQDSQVLVKTNPKPSRTRFEVTTR